MKKNIKKTILKTLETFYNFVYLFKKKKSLNLETVDKVILLHTKPLGLGDMVLLSPFFILITKLKKDIFIVSDYPEFLVFDAKWLKRSEVNDEFFKNAVVISPTLALPHLKYALKAKYFIGYFISNKLISNFSNKNYRYDPVNEHYLDKTFPILDELNISYSNEFEYPKVFKKKFDLKINKKYIVVAPYANWKEKQYQLDNYVELLNNILKLSDYYILIVGSSNPTEVKFNNLIEENINSKRIINFTGKTTLQTLSYLISNSILYIGNDAGPSNIAYISAPKSLVFFGCVKYENILPKNKLLKEKIIVFNNRNCCKIFSCYDGYNKPTCSIENKYCCLDIKLSSEELKNLLEI
jgi:ADP-heptose:LPS heptosyltransferase